MKPSWKVSSSKMTPSPPAIVFACVPISRVEPVRVEFVDEARERREPSSQHVACFLEGWSRRRRRSRSRAARAATKCGGRPDRMERVVLALDRSCRARRRRRTRCAGVDSTVDHSSSTRWLRSSSVKDAARAIVARGVRHVVTSARAVSMSAGTRCGGGGPLIESRLDRVHVAVHEAVVPPGLLEDRPQRADHLCLVSRRWVAVAGRDDRRSSSSGVSASTTPRIVASRLFHTATASSNVGRRFGVACHARRRTHLRERQSDRVVRVGRARGRHAGSTSRRRRRGGGSSRRPTIRRRRARCRCSSLEPRGALERRVELSEHDVVRVLHALGRRGEELFALGVEAFASRGR